MRYKNETSESEVMLNHADQYQTLQFVSVKHRINIYLLWRSLRISFLFFGGKKVVMWTWKLLGDLQAEELKLECERANLVSSDKAFHNCVKLAKYILGNGYDPETFYFNTHYKADKSSPLIGMSASGQLGATTCPASSMAARTSPPAAVNLVTSALKQKNSSDEILGSILGYVTKMSSDIQQLLTIKKQEENIQQYPCTGSGLGEDCSYDGQTWSDDESSLHSLPILLEVN